MTPSAPEDEAANTFERMATRRFTALSLFSGAGGLDVGLDQHGGFRFVACVERNPVFVETLRRNHRQGRFGGRGLEVIEADLAVLDPAVLMDKLEIAPGEIDLVIGGPPCQAFSTAGRRRGTCDPRGELLWAFQRFVTALQPRAFLMENVRGLLSAALKHRPIAQRPARGGPPLTADEEPGSVLRLWLDDFEREGDYRIDCFEVNAVNYGAPQLRERVLFFGNRIDRVAAFPQPTHGPGLAPYSTLRDALRDVVDESPVLMDFSPRKKAYLRAVPPGGNWRAMPEALQRESMGNAFHAKGGRSGWWRRLSWDLPCPTVVTMPNHASTSMCHPDDVRVLSVAECAAVQGFPKGWDFAGTPQEQYEQVGNAVPVRLGEVAAGVLADVLSGRSPRGDGVTRFRREYLRSHVRTRQWYRDGEVFLLDADGAPPPYGVGAR